METVLDKNFNIKGDVNDLETKISEYENNHKNGSGKYFSFDETNKILDKAISTDKHVA